MTGVHYQQRFPVQSADLSFKWRRTSLHILADLVEGNVDDARDRQPIFLYIKL